MDPLSITVGVATLLGCCISAGVALRKFLIGAAEVKTVITAMMADLRALRSVLETMETTFEDMNSDQPKTGHIGAHWTNLFQLLEDGQQSLVSLQLVLEDASKEVKILDSARKQLRIKIAADQIVFCRQEVQTYKDALQLSLQTITLWNAHSIKGTAEEVLVTSRATHQDLQRLATNVELKLAALETLFKASNELGGMAKITNIKRTMTSAATVIAGDATEVANLNELDDLTSDFGDWFRSDASQNTLDWVYSDKRQEPLFVLDGRSREALAERAANHSAPRTLPVHTLPMPGAVPAADTNESNDRLSAPARLPPQMLVEGRPVEEREEPVTPPDNPNARPDSSATDAEQVARPVLLPTVDTSEKSDRKSHKKRLSWFRSNKSTDTITVRSPMMDDKQSTRSWWRKDKLPRRLKIVFVGDGAAGKTCLLIMLTKGAFPEVYVPTVFENYVADFELNKQDFTVSFWDTAGQEDYDNLRPLSYPDSHAVVITFAIDSPDSLDNVSEKWISEASYFCSAAPVFLVGCKKDLRHDQKTIEDLRRTNQKPVSLEQADKVRRRIGAIAYIETSAKTGEGAFQALSTILSETVKYQLQQAAKKRENARKQDEKHHQKFLAATGRAASGAGTPT